MIKRTIFTAATLALSAVLLLTAAEFVCRRRAEGDLGAVWKSLVSNKSPLTRLRSRYRFQADPDLGFIYHPSEPGVNSLGLRTPPVALPKPTGQMRVIVVGDSVAAPQDGFVTQFARGLGSRAEVINAAIPGYTVFQERMLIEKKLLPLAPDLIVLQYCLNDHHRILHEWNDATRMLWTNEAREALLGGGPRLLAVFPDWSYLGLELRLGELRLRWDRAEFPWKNRANIAPAWSDAGWDLWAAEFQAIVRSCRAAGTRFALLVPPAAFQFDPQWLSVHRELVFLPQRRLLGLAEREGVSILDLYGAFDRNAGANLFADQLHLNSAGHAVAAGALLEHLTANGLLNPRD